MYIRKGKKVDVKETNLSKSITKDNLNAIWIIKWYPFLPSISIYLDKYFLTDSMALLWRPITIGERNGKLSRHTQKHRKSR